MPLHTTLEEISMMQNPSRWPHRVILPVKNTLVGDPDNPTFPLAGVLISMDRETVLPVVYLTNLWALDKVESWEDIKTQPYESFDHIAADGWVVD